MKEVPKTYVITGATSGIGLALANDLVAQGMNVIGVGRSPERCQDALTLLRTVNPWAKINYCLADLSLMQQVRALAQQVANQLIVWGVEHLDGLVNNAASLPFHQTTTAEGLDTQWAVNYLSGFLLTDLLLEWMQKAPAARIVSVSSASHYHTRMHWKDVQLFHSYNPLKAYKHTKLAQVIFIAELNRRFQSMPAMKAFAADPGLVDTNIGYKGNSDLMSWIWKLRRRGGIPPEEAARGIAFLLTEPSIQNSDQIYWKHAQPQSPNPRALDEASGQQLWVLSAQMCGLLENIH
jgi:NAD(P)-dependent dehydrogenase (short-subunit alcohol dehydrogenase family)